MATTTMATATNATALKRKYAYGAMAGESVGNVPIYLYFLYVRTFLKTICAYLQTYLLYIGIEKGRHI